MRGRSLIQRKLFLDEHIDMILDELLNAEVELVE